MGWAGVVGAQSTGTPVFQAPYRAFAASELGVTLADPGPGFALEGSYRTGVNPRMDVGVRGGIHDNSRRTSVLMGADFRARVLDYSDSFPLDGSFTLGLGLSSGDGITHGYLPIGFSMGRRIVVEGSTVSLVPYVHPVITPVFGDGSDTMVSVGFGIDARVTPRLDIRFSAAIGDQDGIAFTAAFLR
jgi:hypothetical protein